jgi:hypothetical protein
MKINENLKIIISSKTCDKTKTTGEYGFFKKIFRYHVNKAYILSSLLQSFLISFFLHITFIVDASQYATTTVPRVFPCASLL